MVVDFFEVDILSLVAAEEMPVGGASCLLRVAVGGGGLFLSGVLRRFLLCGVVSPVGGGFPRHEVAGFFGDARQESEDLEDGGKEDKEYAYEEA
jgi:hypothetical protein